jgi:hypothetical protein
LSEVAGGEEWGVKVVAGFLKIQGYCVLEIRNRFCFKLCNEGQIEDLTLNILVIFLN